MNVKRIASCFFALVVVVTCPFASASAQEPQAAAAAAAFSAAPAITCASVVSLALPNTRIISATEVTSATGNYCNVIGVIDERVSSQDPDHFVYGIGFELNLPDSWIGRFEMMGGGGTDGSVGSPMGSAGTELSQGWAVAADDGGHEDAPGNRGVQLD